MRSKARAASVSIRIRVALTLYPLLYRRDRSNLELVRIGTDYGGWWIPAGLLDASSLCYCAGVGTDISFDTGLIERYGCSVWGIDPTPRSIEWVAKLRPDSRFTMIPVGVGGASQIHRFYAPPNHDHVSHSLKNLRRTSDYFEARVLSLSDIMQLLGHDRIDLVKLDVEGAEHDALSRLLQDGIRPRVICVEFDQPEPYSWGLRTTKSLRKVGYQLIKVDGLNLTFTLLP